MFTHPDLVWSQTKQRHQELVADADRYRLLTAARRARRARGKHDNHDARGRPAGNLAACPPRAAAPARP